MSTQIGSPVERWLAAPSARKFALLLLVYLVTTLSYALFAPGELFERHTAYNHFAHLAQAWLDGRLDLAEGAPGYAHNNDFAVFEERTYVVFPPFPAIVLLPFVALAGSPEGLADGAVFLWLAGLGPAFLFLALERLREVGDSGRNQRQNLLLTGCFAFGTVYFFTVEQGTVWFAAHVVSVVLSALYLVLVVDARYPVLAGTVLGLALSTRAPLVFAAPLFAFEAVRVSRGMTWGHTTGPIVRRLSRFWGELDKKRLFALLVAFAVPVAIAIALGWWHNAARFGDPFEPGYRYLTVAWQKRIDEWGLFHYHYLAKNLGVLLTSLPWLEEDVPFRVNAHGLALWFTTPLYLWLLWPKARPFTHYGLWCVVVLVALPTLFYQNTGWAQFGYRFSNDYAVFLFALLAVGMRPLRALFIAAALFSVLVNAFGAATFQRKGYEQYYYWQGAQKILYQPD